MIGPRNHVIPVVSQNLDFTANQFLSKTFALGVRGYYYNQFTGDSGSGAILGDFQGESFGFGPGFIWFPGSVRAIRLLCQNVRTGFRGH